MTCAENPVRDPCRLCCLKSDALLSFGRKLTTERVRSHSNIAHASAIQSHQTISAGLAKHVPGHEPRSPGAWAGAAISF